MATTARASVKFAVKLSIPLAVASLGMYAALAQLGWALPAGLSVLAILTVGQLINAACGSSAQLLSVTGSQVEVFIAQLASFCVGVMVAVALVPRIGIVGAAWGASLGMVGWNIALVIRTRKILGINTSIAGRALWSLPYTVEGRGGE
jgi:O-antigen/teichoic acid export membrane protein